MGRGEGGSALVADVFFYRKAEPLYIYEGAWRSRESLRVARSVKTKGGAGWPAV